MFILGFKELANPLFKDSDQHTVKNEPGAMGRHQQLQPTSRNRLRKSGMSGSDSTPIMFTLFKGIKDKCGTTGEKKA